MTPVVLDRLSGTESLGIFGGTFDPVHIGHLILAECARVELRLDAVVFIPALRAPHKTTIPVSNAPMRLEMLRLATESNPFFAISDYELHHQRISYSIETLRYLHDCLPKTHLTMLIGSDNLLGFKRWHQPDEILRIAKLGVWTRRDYLSNTDIPHERIPAPVMDISSSTIRSRVAEGKSIRYLTPDPVIAYIERHELYRQT